MARRDYQLHARMLFQNLAVSLQHHHVLARPCAAAEQYFAIANPVTEFPFLRLVAVRHVELEAAGNAHRRRISPSVREALCIEIALRVDFRETAEHLAEEPT